MQKSSDLVWSELFCVLPEEEPVDWLKIICYSHFTRIGKEAVTRAFFSIYNEYGIWRDDLGFCAVVLTVLPS